MKNTATGFFSNPKNPNLYIKSGFNVQHGLLVNPLALFLGGNIEKQELHLLLTCICCRPYFEKSSSFSNVFNVVTYQFKGRPLNNLKIPS